MARFARSKSNRVLGGVIGGFAKKFNVDPTLARILYVLLTVCSGFSGTIIYFLLWMLLPSER